MLLLFCWYFNKCQIPYYREAAELVPADEEEVLVDYLSEEGVAFFHAGKYADAQEPLEAIYAHPPEKVKIRRC